MRFSDITGHEDIKSRLRQFADNDRIPHAILLHGDAGVGKLALARAFAQYVQCPNRKDGDSCGVCPDCLRNSSLNQIDTFYTFPIFKKDRENVCDDFITEWKEFLSSYRYESLEKWQRVLNNVNKRPSIYVSESNSILHKMNLVSATTRYKISIIWLPERMEIECANKLLKIIEEPFADSLFILVSDKPQEILPTILSRTQPIKVSKLEEGEMADELIAYAGVSREVAYSVAKVSDGDMNRAEEYLSRDSEMHEFFEGFVELMRKSYMRDFAGLKKWSEKVYAFKREKIMRFMQYCSRMVRENFIMNIHQNDLLRMMPEEIQFGGKFSPFINDRNAEDMLKEFNDAELETGANGNAKIILFDLAFRITKLIRK